MELKENSNARLIQGGIIIFWFLFWLFALIDKFIFEPVFLWVGKDFFEEFVELFASIGINSIFIVGFFYWLVVAFEVLAFLFLTLSLGNYFLKNSKKAEKFFFFGTIIGLAIFTFFTLGDQMFGEREELLEHTLFWIVILVSWVLYSHLSKLKNNKKIEE